MLISVNRLIITRCIPSLKVSTPIKNHSIGAYSRSTGSLSIIPSRHQSTTTSSAVSTDAGSSIIDITNTTGELTLSQIAEKLSTDIQLASGQVPTLADYGLGSYFTPVGLTQNFMDFLQCTGLPWWGSIALTTLCIRSLMLPLVIRSRKYLINMNNNGPEFQRLQKKMTEAKVMGNSLAAAGAANELALLMREKKLNNFDALIPMAQAPIFITFYFALRKMAAAPLDSMKTGGALWFTDLTVADPYYVLPILTALTMAATIEVGSDSGLRPANMKLMKYFMRALPVIALPFMVNFPSAVLCYWLSTNTFSLMQVLFLKLEPVKRYYNIPDFVTQEKKNLPLSNQGFVKGVKETIRNVQVTSRNEDKARADEIRFKQAGLGPVPRTYKRPQGSQAKKET